MSSVQEPLAIGMIGAGFMAQVAHLPAFRRLSSCRIAALADDRGDILDTVGDRFQIANRYRDFHDLLAVPGLGAVVVSMPRRCQPTIVREAIGRGLPVLGEKPLAFTATVAHELAALAKAGGTLLATVYQRRYDAGVQMFAERLRTVLEDGSLGSLLHVRMSNFCATYAIPVPDHTRSAGPRLHRYPEAPCLPDGLPSGIRSDYEYTVNVAIHDLNLLRMLFGDVLQPHGFHVRRGGSQTIVLGLPGADACLSVGPADVGAWDQRLDVYFQKGCLSLIQESTLALQSCGCVVQRSPRGEEVLRPPVSQRVSPFRAQAQAFLRAVQGESVEIATVQDTIHDLELVESLWRQAKIV